MLEIKVKHYLLFLFVIKFFLDFLSPYRDINFLLFNIFCILLILFKIRLLSNFTSKEVLSIFVYFSLCLLWFCIGGELRYFAKFVSIIFIYVAVRLAMLGVGPKDVVWLCRRILFAFAFFMLINLALSFVIASPANRHFFNFEHANLLGSYVLLPAVFVTIISIFGQNRWADKYILTGMALLTTSTGAFLSSLIYFVNVKKIRLASLLLVFTSGALFYAAGYFLTSMYFPDLFVKIYGPISLIVNDGFGELYALSKYRLPMQELGDEYQSSLVWRFYAYLVFWDFIWSQNISGIIFGNGFWGFSEIWNGIAPHNDFLLVLIDFGLIGLLIVIHYLSKIISWGVRNEPLVIPLLVILFLRLLFENNIYSYYIFSGLIMNAVFFYYSRKTIEAKK